MLFWLTGAALALLAGLFGRLYYLGRIRRRQERAIEAEREKTLRLEKQIVEEDLLRAQDELADFIASLAEKNSLIDSITAQLEELSQTDANQPLAKARQHLINSSLLTNENWDEFRRLFEQVHPGFLWRLKTQIPELSPAEERLLALSQLRLDTRQMGRMLGISPDSIRKTRYRLRKKIGADAHSPLSELLGNAPEDSATL